MTPGKRAQAQRTAARFQQIKTKHAKVQKRGTVAEALDSDSDMEQEVCAPYPN